MNSRDIDYYAMRAQQERDNAERAKDMTARRVHEEMAARYTAWLQQFGTSEPQKVSA